MDKPKISLEEEFHLAMIRVCQFARRHRFGNIFCRMVHEHGGVDAAKRLLRASEVQSGFTKLYELRALHMSMEAYVIDEHFQLLFTQEDITEANRRLDNVGYFTK